MCCAANFSTAVAVEPATAKLTPLSKFAVLSLNGFNKLRPAAHAAKSKKTKHYTLVKLISFLYIFGRLSKNKLTNVVNHK